MPEPRALPGDVSVHGLTDGRWRAFFAVSSDGQRCSAAHVLANGTLVFEIGLLETVTARWFEAPDLVFRVQR